MGTPKAPLYNTNLPATAWGRSRVFYIIFDSIVCTGDVCGYLQNAEGKPASAMESTFMLLKVYSHPWTEVLCKRRSVQNHSLQSSGRIG